MIGLISDTHGMLRKEVLENLKDCNLILHAGDIGKPEVIDNLKDISNIEFIRGNCDKDKNIGKEDIEYCFFQIILLRELLLLLQLQVLLLQQLLLQVLPLREPQLLPLREGGHG